MRVVSIASGSKGNAYLVEEDGEAILVDCGVCYKKLKDIEFSAVLVTHSHADHVCGLGTLLKRRDIPVFANAMTAEAVVHECGTPEDAFVCPCEEESLAFARKHAIRLSDRRLPRLARKKGRPFTGCRSDGQMHTFRAVISTKSSSAFWFCISTPL